MCAMRVGDVYHVFSSMLLAVIRRLTALGIKGRSLRAGAVRTTMANNVRHAILGMLPAVHRCAFALGIVCRLLRARII